jgi:AraC-like DNA-binding protein
MVSPLLWPLPPDGETAAFSHLKRTRQRVEPHSHRAHQLIIPVGGRLVFRVGDQAQSVEEPAALVVAAGIRHALESPAGAVDLFAVQLHPEAFSAASALVGSSWRFPPAGVARLARATPLLRELVHQLLFQSGSEQGRASPATALTYASLCTTLVDRLQREQAASQSEAPASFRSEYVDRAVAYLAARLEAPVHLPELARQVGTSPRNLSREFRRELGISPVRFALRLRLDEAARRLWETDAAVKEIALSLGFVSVPRFNTAFRQYKKCTPLEHRAQRP